MIHDRDGAKSGSKTTTCGDCFVTFYGDTPQESATKCAQHQAAGCPKTRFERRIAEQMSDPEFAAGYAEAEAEIAALKSEAAVLWD